MWVWYSLLGVLVLLIVVLSVPISAHIAYDGKLLIRIRFLGIPITLVPQEEKKSKKTSLSKKKKAKTSATKKKKSSSKLKELVELMKQDDLAGTLRFLRAVVRLAAKTIGKLLRSITVKRFDLLVVVASNDAAVTAQRYGKVCGVLYPALASIESVMRIRERDIRIEPNFLMEKSVVRFDVRLRLSLWRLLGIGISLLLGILTMEEKSDPQISKEVS